MYCDRYQVEDVSIIISPKAIWYVRAHVKCIFISNRKLFMAVE